MRVESGNAPIKIARWVAFVRRLSRTCWYCRGCAIKNSGLTPAAQAARSRTSRHSPKSATSSGPTTICVRSAPLAAPIVNSLAASSPSCRLRVVRWMLAANHASSATLRSSATSTVSRPSSPIDASGASVAVGLKCSTEPRNTCLSRCPWAGATGIIWNALGATISLSIAGSSKNLAQTAASMPAGSPRCISAIAAATFAARSSICGRGKRGDPKAYCRLVPGHIEGRRDSSRISRALAISHAA